MFYGAYAFGPSEVDVYACGGYGLYEEVDVLPSETVNDECFVSAVYGVEYHVAYAFAVFVEMVHEYFDVGGYYVSEWLHK